MNAVISARRGAVARLVLASLLWSAAMSSFAQDANIVMLRPAAAVEIAAGHSAPVRIEVTVRPGYHVQANPVRNRSLIPTTVELAPVGGVIPGPRVYPPSKLFRIAGSSEDLVVYDGTFTIETPVRVAAAHRPALVLLQGTLRYQACTDKLCLVPRTIALRIPIRVI